MKAIFLESQAKDCYVIGTNDELRKLLGACSHHKGLAPKPFVFRSGEVTYEFCKISDEEMDDLHVVCFERGTTCESASNVTKRSQFIPRLYGNQSAIDCHRKESEISCNSIFKGGVINEL